MAITGLRDPHARWWRAVLTIENHTIEVLVGDVFEVTGQTWRLQSVTEIAGVLSAVITPVRS